MARRNQGLDDDDDILQQLWEVSSGNSGSDTDSESDMDTFSLNSPVDASESESDDGVDGILLGCPQQAPQLQGNTVVWNWNQQDVQPCNQHFSASSGVKVPLTDESTVSQIF